MKLASKLTAFILAAMILVFAVRGYQAARRQMTAAEHRVRESALVVGRALRPAVVEIWSQEGPGVALEMLSSAADSVRHTQQLELRFVEVHGAPKPAARPLVALDKLANLASDEERLFVERVAADEAIVAYLPVRVHGALVGALEVAGSLSERDEEFRAELTQILVRTLLGALAAFVSVAVAGYYFVGRPMRALVAKSRRIGTGDLSQPLDLKQRDEVGELAREMNQMCERLAEAQVRLEQETQRRLDTSEQLRHADRLNTVGKLASGVAHELGTPLNVVSGRAKMILRGQVEGAKLTESVRTIVDQAERMTNIIKQLLGFARRRQPQQRKESLRGICDRTVALLSPIAEKAKVECQIVHREPEPIAEIDASLIEQALTNLVMNAIQAMRKGGTLTVRSGQEVASPPADLAGRTATYAVLHVEDTGIGMTDEQLRHVFEPFFTTKDVGSGTGLGLSVAHGIVRDHDGWIAVSSKPDQGSRFSIYLPLTSEHQKDAKHDQERSDRG